MHTKEKISTSGRFEIHYKRKDFNQIRNKIIKLIKKINWKGGSLLKILVGELYQNYENYKWSIKREKSRTFLKNTRPLRDSVLNYFSILITWKKN